MGGPVKKNMDLTELMEAYVDENLEDPVDHTEVDGHLTFEYFLKLYKTAMIWNRV